jgi:hypothetical protein
MKKAGPFGKQNVMKSAGLHCSRNKPTASTKGQLFNSTRFPLFTTVTNCRAFPKYLISSASSTSIAFSNNQAIDSNKSVI